MKILSTVLMAVVIALSSVAFTQAQSVVLQQFTELSVDNTHNFGEPAVIADGSIFFSHGTDGIHVKIIKKLLNGTFVTLDSNAVFTYVNSKTCFAENGDYAWEKSSHCEITHAGMTQQAVGGGFHHGSTSIVSFGKSTALATRWFDTITGPTYQVNDINVYDSLGNVSASNSSGGGVIISILENDGFIYIVKDDNSVIVQSVVEKFDALTGAWLGNISFPGQPTCACATSDGGIMVYVTSFPGSTLIKVFPNLTSVSTVLSASSIYWGKLMKQLSNGTIVVAGSSSNFTNIGWVLQYFDLQANYIGSIQNNTTESEQFNGITDSTVIAERFTYDPTIFNSVRNVLVVYQLPSTPTAVHEVTPDNFQIYPTYIKNDYFIVNSKIESDLFLSDMAGKAVSYGKIPVGNTKVSMPYTAKGMYFATFVTNNATFTQKLMVQ